MTSSAIEYRRTLEEPPGYAEGHDIRPVRDREAEGSNSSPPTNSDWS